MTTLKNETGTKAVNIRKNADLGNYIAMYVDVYDGEEQVLDTKKYSTEKRAIAWAKKQLA